MGLAFALTACSSLTPLHPDPPYSVPDTEDPNQRAASLLQYCVKLHEGGDLNLAAAICNRAHEFDPTDPGPLVELAGIYSEQKRPNPASEAYRAALLLDPQSVDALYGLGKVYIDQQHYDLAMEPLQSAALLETKDPRVYNAMGVVMDQQGEHAAAQAYYQQGLAHEPRNISLRNNMGLSLVLSGDETAGMAMLREVATEPAATATASRNLEMAAQIAIENRKAAAEVAEIDASAQTDGVETADLDPMSPPQAETTAPRSRPTLPETKPQVNATPQPQTITRRAPSIATTSTSRQAASAAPASQPMGLLHPPAPEADVMSAAPEAPEGSMDQEIASTYAAPASRPMGLLHQPAPEADVMSAAPEAPEGSMDQEIASTYAVTASSPQSPETPVAQSDESEASQNRPSFSRSEWRADMAAFVPQPAAGPDSQPSAETASAEIETPVAPAATSQAAPPRLAQSSGSSSGSVDAPRDLPISVAGAAPETEASEPPQGAVAITGATFPATSPSASPTPSPTGTTQTAAATAKAEAPESAQPSAPGDSFYAVQLASYKDTKSARRGWDILRDSAGGLLSSIDGMIVEADLGAEVGTVYRVRTAPLDDNAAANQLCEQLRAKGLDCMPVKASRQATDKALIERVCHDGSEATACGEASATPIRERAAERPAIETGRTTWKG